MADQDLFDMKEVEEENKDKDPLTIKERLMLNYYIDMVASGETGAKTKSYMRAWLETTPEESPGSYHGARVTAVDVWRRLERKMGVERMAHEIGIDNHMLLTKLKNLMSVNRIMMRKTLEGDQEAVEYPDAGVQLKATETLIKIINDMNPEDKANSAPTLNIVFGDKSNDWSNVEVSIPKKTDELIGRDNKTE